MKKLYTIFLASAAVLSASAASDTPVASSLRTPVYPSGDMKASSLFSSEKGKRLERNGAMAVRKATEPSSVEGTWTFVLNDIYFGSQSSFDGIPVEYIATVEGTTVTFTPTVGDFNKMIATFDPYKNTFTFSKMMIGTEVIDNKTLYLYQDPAIYNYDTDKPDYQDIIGYYSPTQDIIVFNDYNAMFWNYYRMQNGTQLEGPANIYDLLIASTPLPGQWTDLGNATFVDGWVMPALGIDQTQNAYQVPMQQYSENPNIYRLVDPYKYGPVAPYNTSTSKGYIYVNITDEDHVTFRFADAGFATEGITQFYPYDTFSLDIFLNPDYAEDYLLDYFENQGIPFTTYKDGVVTVTGFSPNGYPNARFGFSWNPLIGNFSAIDEQGTPANMTASITFPSGGVGEIVADDENAPVEYYNLQGVRVYNPEAGQLLIKKQGNKTVKEIVR